eukprot:6206592-Pleurochrysis_carterae.AAC.5
MSGFDVPSFTHQQGRVAHGTLACVNAAGSYAAVYENAMCNWSADCAQFASVSNSHHYTFAHANLFMSRSQPPSK